MHSTALRLIGALALALLLLSVAGCETVAYYSHAALGQWRVLSAREDVPAVLDELAPHRDDDPRSALLYEHLVLSQNVLDFARSELALDVGKRYRTYADLERNAVVWNLFAAPPLSLEPHRWCYPIVGCAPYRGYFDLAYAERRAAALRDQGLETYLGPVAAYSTLGWFADPLLNTFIGWPEPDLAELLFHELAHGMVWVKGDVAFNESFATFVGRQGLAAWLDAHGRPGMLADRREALAGRRRLLALLDHTRRTLQSVYASDLGREDKLAEKARILDAVTSCYSAARDELGRGRFDHLMRGLDNARLVSVATYEDLVPGFERLFTEAGGHWPAFYERVRALAARDAQARRAALGPSGNEQPAQGADHRGTDQVECQALAGHFLDGEAAGGVDDDVRRRGDG